LKNLSRGFPTASTIYPNMYYESSGAGTAWNFASWQADVVVVALGTNDFSAGDPGSANFKTAYLGFLTSLRTYYPGAYILCTEPIPAWVSANAGTYIQEVVTAKSDTKDFYVH
jgi:lysophospholipase L1-like esterase